MIHAAQQTLTFPWSSLLGVVIVLDMKSPYVFLGKLVSVEGEYLTLEDVDAHDLRDTATNREKYILDSRMHGVSVNRQRCYVRLAEVVSIARLDDVILP